MKDLNKRKDLLAVLLIFIAILLITISMSPHSTINGAIVGVTPDNKACIEDHYKSCASLCVEKENDDLSYELPSDWFESCLNSCERTAEKRCS